MSHLLILRQWIIELGAAFFLGVARIQAEPADSNQGEGEIARLEAKLSVTEKEFAERAKVWSPKHPRYQALVQEIANLRSVLADRMPPQATAVFSYEFIDGRYMFSVRAIKSDGDCSVRIVHSTGTGASSVTSHLDPETFEKLMAEWMKIQGIAAHRVESGAATAKEEPYHVIKTVVRGKGDAKFETYGVVLDKTAPEEFRTWKKLVDDEFLAK
jgi:hypothetical protein